MPANKGLVRVNDDGANEGTGATQDRTIDLMIASDERTRAPARLLGRGCGKAARGPRYLWDIRQDRRTGMTPAPSER